MRAGCQSGGTIRRSKEPRMSPGTARRFGGVAVVLAALLAGTPGASANPANGRAPVVVTEGGVVRGTADGAVDRFLGIPYAAPPVGQLRWRPPAPAARWQGIRDASAFAPHCAQPASPFGIASTSEDCLY